ncbi:hypothetical protein ACQJBY_030824 [Aegilops geniculata]
MASPFLPSASTSPSTSSPTPASSPPPRPPPASLSTPPEASTAEQLLRLRFVAVLHGVASLSSAPLDPRRRPRLEPRRRPAFLDLDLDLLCFPRPRSISSRGAGTSSLPLPWSSRPLASRRRSPLRAGALPPLLHVKADADRIVQRQVPASSAPWLPPP